MESPSGKLTQENQTIVEHEGAVIHVYTNLTGKEVHYKIDLDRHDAEEATDLQDSLVKEAKRLREDSGLDTIQIVGTFCSDGHTYTVFAGDGNFSARVGSAREFVIRDDERTRANIRKEEEES